MPPLMSVPRKVLAKRAFKKYIQVLNQQRTILTKRL